MLELQSIAVLPGVAIGKVLISSHDGFGINHSQIHSSDRYLKTLLRPAEQAGPWRRLDFSIQVPPTQPTQLPLHVHGNPRKGACQ